MIQEANIGVGIMGKEGNQATSSSDFYFGRFKFLDRLLLHHGRWSYYRMAYFFVYFGWKNLTITMILFYFMAYSAFSGLPALSDSFVAIYNSIIAIALVFYYTILEQDINSDTYPDSYCLEPLFYKEFKSQDLFSYRRYILWSIMGVLLSLFIHYGFILALGGTSIVSSNGYPGDYSTYASGVAISLSIIVTFVIITDLNNFNWFTVWVIIVLLTILPAVIFFIVENYSFLTNFSITYALSDNFFFRYWAVMWLICVSSLLIKIAFTNFISLWFPLEI